jgi:hypothetical protein
MHRFVEAGHVVHGSGQGGKAVAIERWDESADRIPDAAVGMTIGELNISYTFVTTMPEVPA